MPPYLSLRTSRCDFTAKDLTVHLPHFQSHHTSLRIHGAVVFVARACALPCPTASLWSEEETGLLSGSGNPSMVSIRRCGEAITPPFAGVPSSRGACFRETVLSSVCYDGEAQTLSSPASRGCILLPLIQSVEDTMCSLVHAGAASIDERYRF